MTNHVISDHLFTGDFATIRDAYRVGEGNSTIREACERKVGLCLLCRAYGYVYRLPTTTARPHGSGTPHTFKIT